MNAFRIGRLRRVKKDQCRECFGDGIAAGATHIGRGIWWGRKCWACDGTGKRVKQPAKDGGR